MNNFLFSRYRRQLFAVAAVLLLSGVLVWFVKQGGFPAWAPKPSLSLLADKNEKKTPPIHFEFYTTLPRMKLKLAAPPLEPKLFLTKSIISPEELERDFSKQLHSPKSLSTSTENYVLQMGLFKTQQAASRFQAMLRTQGMESRTNLIRMGQVPAYRVETGSYSSKEAAKKVQHQLQQKGFSTIIKLKS